MKRNLAISVLSVLFVLVALNAAADSGDAKYVTPSDVSLEDVFFTRLYSDIYDYDSTITARPVTASASNDSARWTKEFASLTLWGSSESSATDVYNAAVRLFLKHQKVEYADVAERALYNGVLAELDSSRRGTPEWRKAAQTVRDAIATAYASKGCDLWVNMYYRGRAYVKSDSLDMLILQNTSAPWNSNVFFSLRFNNDSTHMRLHLRLPAWLRGCVTPGGKYTMEESREFYQVVVNGKMLTLRASADGYVTIDRVWRSNDVVRFSMQTPVRRIHNNKDKLKTFAVQEGPILYAVETRGDKQYFDPEAAFGDNYDNKVLHANCLTTKVYTKRKIGDESPWEAVLIPYYIAFGRNNAQPAVWLNAVKK